MPPTAAPIRGRYPSSASAVDRRRTDRCQSGATPGRCRISVRLQVRPVKRPERPARAPPFPPVFASRSGGRAWALTRKCLAEAAINLHELQDYGGQSIQTNVHGWPVASLYRPASRRGRPEDRGTTTGHCGQPESCPSRQARLRCPRLPARSRTPAKRSRPFG